MCKSGRFARQFLSFCIRKGVGLVRKTIEIGVQSLSFYSEKGFVLLWNGVAFDVKMRKNALLGGELFPKTNFFVELFKC